MFEQTHNFTKCYVETRVYTPLIFFSAIFFLLNTPKTLIKSTEFLQIFVILKQLQFSVLYFDRFCVEKSVLK